MRLFLPRRLWQNGIFLITLSMLLTPLGDALSKQLGAQMPALAIVFLRYLAAGLLALALARALGRPVCLPRSGRRALLLSTALVMASMALLVAALARAPLALAVGAFMVAPLVAMLVAALLFGERLSPARLAGALSGFAGAMLILRPPGSFEPAMLLALAGGICLGLFLALNRGGAGRQDPVSALAVQCLLGSAMLAPLALPGLAAFRPAMALPVLLLGLLTAATHFLTVGAYRKSDATTLAPFFYVSLVVALVVGLLWLGEFPAPSALFGMGLIALGGLLGVFGGAIGQGMRGFPRNRPQFG